MTETKADNSSVAEVQAEYFVSTPELIGQIGFFPLTNTFLTSCMVTLCLSVTAIIFSKKITLVPGRFQAFIEIIVEYIYNLTKQLAHSKVTAFFPWLMTFVLFILTANLSGLLPGFSSIGIYKVEDGMKIFVPLLRSANSDLNMTLGLALVSVMVTHFFSIRFLGFKEYLKKWFSIKMFGASLFVGLLELMSEFTKVISLSFRLFGNIMAGKVLLKTAKSFFPFLVPLPFYFLEVMVSFVQAAVFMMLTLVFMVILSSKHDHDD